MSYTPGLNGGRINATIGGNTAGVRTLVSSGTLTLAGGNNITLSQNGNAITISGGAAGGGGSNSFGMSNIGNTLGTTGMASGSAVQFAFAGGNNVTLSQSLNASSGTITISAANQTVQPGIQSIQVSDTTYSTGNIIFSNANGLSFGSSAGGGITGSYTVPGATVFSNSNNVSFGLNGSTVTATATVVQTNQTIGLYASSNTTQSSSGTVDARSLTFAGAGIASVGATNGSIIISVPAGGGAFTAGVSTSGNTSGTTGTVTNQLIFAGGNNITLSQSTGAGGNTIEISAVAPSIAAGAPANFTFGTLNTISSNLAQFHFLNMTVSQSSNTISVSAASPFALIGGINGGNTIGGTKNANRLLAFYGGSNVTLEMSTSSGGAFDVSQSISIHSPTPVTLSTWEPWPIHNTGTAVLSANTNTSGAASFIPMIIDQNVAAGYLNMIMSANLTTGGTSVYSQSVTQSYGLYTRGTGANSTTLSAITSGSLSYQVSYNNSTMTVSQATATSTNGYGYGSTTSANVNLSSGYTGLKMVQMPISSVMTPGMYWLGLYARNSTVGFNSGLLQSYYGNAYSLTGLAPMGSFSSAYTSGANQVNGNGNWAVGFGSFTSAGQTNLPSTVALSAISQNVSVIPYMKFVIS